MDQKPYRAGAPQQRPVQRTTNGARPQPRPADPQTAAHPGTPPQQQISNRKRLSKNRILLIGIPVLLLIALIGWILYSRSTSTLIDGNTYQAVFLSNGQVYFGKLHEKNSTYSTLTDVYYFESNNSSSSSATATATTSNVVPKLIKLGQEIHAPQDQMAIKNSQILFFENITPNGQVAKAITNYQQKQ